MRNLRGVPVFLLALRAVGCVRLCHERQRWLGSE